MRGCSVGLLLDVGARPSNDGVTLPTLGVDLRLSVAAFVVQETHASAAIHRRG